MKRVIDAETMQQLDTFDEAETEKVREKYLASGNWSYVEVDYDGDIILNND